MSQITARIAWRWIRRLSSRLGVPLALLALSLRVAVSPPVPISTDVADLAAFGEHALCVSVAVDVDSVPTSRHETPEPANDTDHDHSLCCLWHAVSSVLLPGVNAGVRLAPFEAILAVAAPTELHPAKLTGTIRVRGPPSRV